MRARRRDRRRIPIIVRLEHRAFNGGISSVFEVVPAHLFGVKAAAYADAPEMGLKLGERHLDRVEVQAVRRQDQAPRCLR